MKAFTIILLTSIPFTYAACWTGGWPSRCKNEDGPVSGDYTRTKEICDNVGGDMCNCIRQAEEYCEFDTQDQADEFKSECESQSGWSSWNCAEL
ncbi:hypothetical protein ANOM_011855 [Aspergillus nomiae NRRL 13137]|uniref:Extracellular membrane protein CFEM domain-containing protein n=1 Tax=Aspergillus nomiae NRRL (strain ATCC 15546 / NRRL 13137 / CBS 260.88 / M93) TaxID=1509407 RepID=A0A0L1IK14_ASPN3|nr:uncharacterized protein ANOM_011855 [Aspergillus nomiae NRRL 13137]KNG79847.1 hypothetical protein ANOM_011855 [Aspergillus nomiae NRRL 13137]